MPTSVRASLERPNDLPVRVKVRVRRFGQGYTVLAFENGQAYETSGTTAFFPNILPAICRPPTGSDNEMKSRKSWGGELASGRKEDEELHCTSGRCRSSGSALFR